ncbi:MAG: flagellar biosynthetic protein FliO, partial [Clostridiales bacterium]|nr:flagellar biosynthetic protein FliO [Clostridiales bacterium]
MDATFEVILFIVLFGAILFLAYVATKFVAGKSGKAMKGKHINVIETVSLGPDKRLHLIKAGNQYMLISSTSKQVQFLDRVDIPEEEDESLAEGETDNNIFEFRKFFDKYV